MSFRCECIYPSEFRFSSGCLGAEERDCSLAFTTLLTTLATSFRLPEFRTGNLRHTPHWIYINSRSFTLGRFQQRQKKIEEDYHLLHKVLLFSLFFYSAILFFEYYTSNNMTVGCLLLPVHSWCIYPCKRTKESVLVRSLDTGGRGWQESIGTRQPNSAQLPCPTARWDEARWPCS